MEQHGGLPVRRLRLYVEIGHIQLLALGRETIMRDRIGIVEALQFRPIGGLVGGLR
jgi:hypothetical protein